jgi:acyl-CoA reductase-like NAD-dependent aldehyde dehydrogenase
MTNGFPEVNDHEEQYLYPFHNTPAGGDMTYPTQPKASHFIGGAYVEDTSGTPIDVIYPATGEVIATVYAATPAIIEQAITSAKVAQAAWAAMTGTERGRILRRASEIMRERNHDLSILETYDTGKPYQETSVAKTGSTRAAKRWAFASGSGRGTTPHKSPAGKGRPLLPAAIR